MSYGTLDEIKIKELFKQALVELLQERRDRFYDVIAEIVEDIALVRAIKEGEETGTIHREAIFLNLEGAS